MENLDVRQVAAARYVKAIHSNSLTNIEESDAIRMAIYLLYVDLLERPQASSPDAYRLNAESGYADALSRAYARERKSHGSSTPPNLDFGQLGDRGVRHLVEEISRVVDRADRLQQLDYLVESLIGLHLRETTTLLTEKFAVQFAKRLGVNGATLVDLGSSSSGELGAQIEAVSGLWLSKLSHRADFEVFMKLEVRGLHPLRFDATRDFSLQGLALCLFLPPRKDARVAELRQALDYDNPGTSGLTMAIWAAKRPWQSGTVALTVLSLRDCREKNQRADLRRQLIRSGLVRAVVELPRRVATKNRQFLLLLDNRIPAREQDVIFIDGRYCDVLRDETLDRIAAFISIPVLAKNVSDLERIWPDWRQGLGSGLAMRAVKTLFSENREIRGFCAFVEISRLLQSENFSLEPANWVTPTDMGGSVTLLDPTPLRELLDSTQPCCAYVIGDNGVGKSFLLRSLLDHYGGQGRAVRAISSTSADRFPEESKSFENYRYLGARTTQNGTSSRLLARRTLELLQAIYREPRRVAILERASEMIGFKGRHFVLPGGLIATQDSVADLQSIDEVAFTDLRSGDRPGFQRSESNVIVPFDHLSTGEQQILLLLARLVAEASEGTLFIIDEPETSLHVAWQRALPGVLDVLRGSFQVQFVVATHSPVLLSAASASQDFRFIARGGMIEQLPDRTDSVERILFEGFGTYTDSNREVHERCAEIISEVIERANVGELATTEAALNELVEMRLIVERSIPSLGRGRTNAHLRLIDQATTVLIGLQSKLDPSEISV